MDLFTNEIRNHTIIHRDTGYRMIGLESEYNQGKLMHKVLVPIRDENNKLCFLIRTVSDEKVEITSEILE